MKKTDVSQEKVLIGKVGSPVGIKGEFRVNLYSQDSGNLKEGKVLLLERAGKMSEAPIVRVRYQKDKPVVKLEGVDDRNAAEEIRGMDVSIYAEDMEELPEGEHYVRDIIGFKVINVSKRTAPGDAGDNAQGSSVIGILEDVIQNTAQSILDVRTPDGKNVLIPAVDAFLRSVDEEAGVIEVELIPGFLD